MVFVGHGCVLYASVHPSFRCVLSQYLESIAMLRTGVTSLQVVLSTAMHFSDYLRLIRFFRSCTMGSSSICPLGRQRIMNLSRQCIGLGRRR